MSEARDASVASSTINYKSVSSTEKYNVAHDIVISDFADWKDSYEFFGPASVSFDVPIYPSGGVQNSDGYIFGTVVRRAMKFYCALNV